MNLQTVLRKRLTRAATAVLLCAASLLATAQTVTYFHNDAAGTPLLATDTAGAVVWKESYQPYGGKLNNQEAALGNRIGFAGKPYDNVSGLAYLGARYYDPVLGRFMGVDPAAVEPGSVHGFNRYAYANSNPYKYVDPDGRAAETIFDLAFAAYDGGKLLGATAAWVVGKLTGDGSLAAEGAAGMQETRGDAGMSLASVVVPGLSASMLRGADAVGSAAKGAGIVAKDGTAITGLTKHGVDRVIGDGAKRAGTKPDAILDAVKNPTKVKEGVDTLGRPFKVYTGENARVVMNPETGKIVSTNPLSREGAHLP